MLRLPDCCLFAVLGPPEREARGSKFALNSESLSRLLSLLLCEQAKKARKAAQRGRGRGRGGRGRGGFRGGGRGGGGGFRGAGACLGHLFAHDASFEHFALVGVVYCNLRLLMLSLCLHRFMRIPHFLLLARSLKQVVVAVSAAAMEVATEAVGSRFGCFRGFFALAALNLD